jgi:DNA-binding MarR family transcriptional regulator
MQPAPRAPKKRSASVPLDPEAARVLRRFRVVFNAVRTHFGKLERKTQLSGAQVWALSVVRDQPGIGVGALARAMDVHQSTASNLLRGLVEAGLVVAQRSREDGRAVRLKVTAQGLKSLRAAPGPYAGVLPEALATLDPATLRRLDRDLGKLIQVLSPREDGARKPLGELLR